MPYRYIYTVDLSCNRLKKHLKCIAIVIAVLTTDNISCPVVRAVSVK